MMTLADKGGTGGLDPPFLADIICEQPLRHGSPVKIFSQRVTKSTGTTVFVEQPLAFKGLLIKLRV